MTKNPSSASHLQSSFPATGDRDIQGKGLSELEYQYPARWKLGPPWSTRSRAHCTTAAAAAATADIAAACCSGARTGCSARLEVRLPSAGLDGLRRGLGRACGTRVGAEVFCAVGAGAGAGSPTNAAGAERSAKMSTACVHACRARTQECRTEIEILPVEISPVEIFYLIYSATIVLKRPFLTAQACLWSRT